MPDDSIITYEALYEILRLEKYKQELQVIDPDFLQKVVRYIREKNISIDSQRLKDSVFAPLSIKKTKKQVENAQRIMKELYEKRESKIIQLAILRSRTDNTMKGEENLLSSEKRFFDELMQILNKSRDEILNKILEGKAPNILEEPKPLKIEEKAPDENKTIKFKEVVPKFVGEDLEVYGPFEKGQSTSLPPKIAEILIKNKRAEDI